MLTLHPASAAAPPPAGAPRSGYNDYFHARTRRIAHALAGGEHIPRNLLLKILKNRSIEPGALALWVDVLARKDPVYALDRLGLLESTATEIPASSSNATPSRTAAAGEESCPDWLYLALPGLVTHRSHVPYLASQILSDRFSRLGEQKRALFVARCVQHFLRVRHYVALRELVEWVACADLADAAAGALTKTESFEVVLAALASERVRSDRYDATPYIVLEPLVTLLLASHARRTGNLKSPLTFAMYRSLLSTKLVPRDPEQALRLLARMTRDGLTPSRGMLQRVMRVCARNGRHDATMRILEQIRGEIPHATGALRRGRAAPVPAPEWTERLEEAIEQVHSAGETPLHLRGWNGVDLDGQPESYPPSPEEDTLLLGAEDPDDLPLEAVRVRNHAPPPSLLPSTAKPEEVDEAGSTTPVRALQDKFSTILLTDRAQVLPYFYEILSHATTTSTSSSRSSFPPPPAYFDRVSWIQFFHTVSLQPDVTADQLVAVLQAVARASSTTAASTSTAYVPPMPTLRLHTIVLHALVRRNEPRAALHLWRFLEKRGWQPDVTLLDAVVRAHLALDHDRPALRLLEHYAHRPGVDKPESRVTLPPNVGPDATAPARPHSVVLTAVPLNAILAYYSQKNRFGAAYSLYKEMTSRFAVEPDSATLSIMLDAARHASSRAGRGWTPASAFEEVSAAGPVFGGSMSAHRTGWSSSTDRVVDDAWDGEPASRVMERFVTHEVLEMNWQDAQIETPWEARGVVGWLARRFALREVPFRRPESTVASDVPAEWYPFASTLSPTPPTQPHLYPTDRVFRSLIRLVGTHSSITTIPTLVSWMRHLQITPSRFTLCIALAYVDGEASFRPEQMERWRIWLAEWLGEDALPTQAEIAWMRRGGKREGKPVTRRI